MDCLAQVLEKLTNKDINPSVDAYSIPWFDSPKNECFIQLKNMDCAGENLAWFQSSEKDEHRLMVYQNGSFFSWEPITYNPHFGCDCNLLKWFDNHLVFIYKEKHDTYICSLKESEVKTFNFHGNKIALKENVILFEEYGQEHENIRRIQLPHIEEMEPLARSEAEKKGLLPQMTLFPNQLKTSY